MHLICLAVQAHAEVFWLNIPVNEPLLVHTFQHIEHLNSKIYRSLQREATSTYFQQVLKVRPEHLHHDDIEVSFSAYEIHHRYTLRSLKCSQALGFVKYLRILIMSTFHLYAHFYLSHFIPSFVKHSIISLIQSSL